MQSSAIIILLGLMAGIGFLVFFFNKKISELQKPNESNALLMQALADLRRDVSDGHGKNRVELQERLDRIVGMMKQGQNDSVQTMQKQFAQSSQIIQEVTKNLTGLMETNKQVLGFTEQMKSLESILKNPKQRGILGEYFLETLLSNVFSDSQYKIQYKFGNGEIVDAAIFYNELIVPIDAKFSLEKYNLMIKEEDLSKREEIEKLFKKDVQNRIDETSKYIRPEENTTNFAFMFVPAEGVYHSLVSSVPLIEYALKKNVMIVSPTSFFGYLQTILHGLKRVKMEKSINDVLKNIEQLGKHVIVYDEHMQRLGKQLGTTISTYNQASREFKKIDKDIYKLSEGQVGGTIEILTLEKPMEEEA